MSTFLGLSKDVARHGNIQHPVVIISFDINTTLQLTLPIFLYFVGLGERQEMVLGVLMSNLFDAKIINHECELDGTADMPP